MKTYSKPRLKSLVEFYSNEDKIYFFARPGVAITLEDKSKFIETVCKLMDGEKKLYQLNEILNLSYPKETTFLSDLLQVLDNEFLLEDTEYNQPVSLNNYETERWSRNIEFFGAHCKAQDNKYQYQYKLKSAKVAIFGLGGVGSNVLYNLSAMGVPNLTAIDYDNVELSNLNRQIIYNESDVGKLKSIAAKNSISRFSPYANLKFINKKITSSKDIENIISGHDIVISAIDHPRHEIMDWFNEACIKTNIPFICGALDSRLAICYTIIPGITGCIECWKHSASKSNFRFQELIQQESFVAATSPNIAIMPFISIISGLIGNEFLKIVTGIAEPQSLGRLCTFDFLTSNITTTENWGINPDCPACQKG